MADHVRLSKTLSYWLRHRPDEANLSLDAQGWASVDDVLAALEANGLASDFDTMLDVVESSDKQRFELSPDVSRIRARQGHSIDVDLALDAVAPPDVLYHGTVDRFLAAIMAEGLSKMRRHHVHLSPDTETARRVGARRGRPVVLMIDARAMYAEGLKFYVTTNNVWLTESVAARFLARL
jgi:putative RNA 2'-phosphotransferase